MSNVTTGDIARIVGAAPGEEQDLGKIVAVGPREHDYEGALYWQCTSLSGPLTFHWFDGADILEQDQGLGASIPDEYLKRIRPSDGEDEMLRIAGKPAERDETLAPKPQVEHAR